MLQLLHPTALWTLAALALPLAIHLRRPPPCTVRLGSLRFLENAPRRPLRHLRWRELLLLCARLGMLAALSLLLAEPRWVNNPFVGPQRWALLDPTAALTGESLARWHHAQANGYELRRLVPGFPTATNESSTPVADSNHNTAAPDLWSLLREADAQLPAGSTLAVFSPGRLAALRGNRAALAHCKVEWFQAPDLSGDEAHVWVADASEKRLLEGRSDARATVFTLKPPGASASHGPTPPAVSVLILHDAEHSNDARYVEAAVRAASESAGRPANLQNRDITPDAENAAATDWTFWLSTRPVPAGLADRVPRIVCYAGGDAVAEADRIAAPPGDATDGVPVWRRALPTRQAPAGTNLWTDGQGNPLLTYSHPGPGAVWELYTRFDPAWTDLPRTAALSVWMRALLFPEFAALSDAGPIHDRRPADPSQGLPSDAHASEIPTLAPVDQSARDLRWPLWIVAALLFVAERILSLRRSPVPGTVSTPRPAPVAAVSR